MVSKGKGKDSIRSRRKRSVAEHRSVEEYVKTRLIKSTADGSIDQATETLRAGGLVAFPTDTVYGLGSLAFNDDAILRLFEVKQRSSDRAIPVLISEMDQFEMVSTGLSPLAKRLAEHYWPGALTLVVRKSSVLPESISRSDTVGVRMPDHSYALALLSAVGPMAVTSANISDNPALSQASEVFDILDGKVDLVIDGGTLPGSEPSTIVDCRGARPIVLRVGPITQKEIEQFISA
jgi:L-threonylcarbamoyladenylate synthase